MTEPNVKKLFLEDLSVGQCFTAGTYTMTAENIKTFAREFDPQPFHTDEEAAKHSLFKGLAASGWHTAVATMKLLVEVGVPISGGLIGAGGEITWPRPTRPGDVLRVNSEIIDIRVSRSKPDRGIVSLRSKTVNQKDEVLQILVAKLVVPCRNSTLHD